MAYSRCLADALRGMEFHLARDQVWVARFATDFIRGNSIRDCNRRPVLCFRRACWTVAAYSRRFRAARAYWPVDVWAELRFAFLGRTACLIRSRRGVAGHHSNLWDGFCAMN